MTTRTFIVPVQAASSLPTPTSGQVLLVGSNTANSIKSSGWTDGQWDTALFDMFGGGTFMPSYGTHGAYVIGSSGGHATGENIVDVAAFDFGTETWSLLANVNGAINRANDDYAPSDTNDTPNYELAVPTGITADTVPAPAHCYQSVIADGTTFLRCVGPFVCNPSVHCYRSHAFNTGARSWVRYSTNLCPSAGFGAVGLSEAVALHDTGVTPNRVWLFGQNVVYSNPLPYLDLSTGAWSTITTPNAPSGGAGYGHYLLHNDGTNRAILNFHSGSGTGLILNLNNTGAGWTSVTLSGSPGFGPMRWAKSPVNGAYYTYAGTGTAITKLTPPANPFSGTWAFSTVTPTSGSLPQRTGYNRHYCNFVYVTARNCFAWIAGGSQQVALWNP